MTTSLERLGVNKSVAGPVGFETDIATTIQGNSNGVPIPVTGGPIKTQEIGTHWTIKRSSGSYSSSGDQTLVEAVTGKCLKVFDLTITVNSSTAVQIKITNGVSGSELFRATIQCSTNVSSGISKTVTLPCYLFATSVGTLLNLNLSAAVSCDICLGYIEE